ncbi:MAG: hypothetical protein ABSF63_03965 [Candidatus Bathyarchaeia archaeon]|jgi:hypothetical protein
MIDRESGVVEGLMIGLLITEMHKKHPQRIQPELLKILQNVSKAVAHNAIDRIAANAGFWEKKRIIRRV